MKLAAPENSNYAAVVVKIKNIEPLAGCDNVVATSIFGFQAIVGKDTQVGDIGIVFPAESQLSDEFAHNNNLYRHSDKNRDESAKGYLEDNRRVKAMKFRGHRSDCLFIPLTSLNYIMDKNIFDAFSVAGLKEGDTFDTLSTHEICKKYVVKTTHKESRLERNKNKYVRVDTKFLPEHYDSENYFRNRDAIPQDTRIVVTQKLHGTSIRVGNTIVSRKLTLLDRIVRCLGVKVSGTEFDYVFGSRKVIKDINNPNQNHYYSTDIWTIEGRKLEGLIPENFLVYGELIGYTPNGAPIQKNYTYDLDQTRTCALYIYRVAFVNGQGVIVDLSWEQVKEFCRDRGLKHVPELWSGLHKDFQAENWMDIKFQDLLIGTGPFDGEPLDCVILSPESPCDEGVCIRVDGLAPYILKAKSPMFFEHETKMLDQEVVDLETEGSTE